MGSGDRTWVLVVSQTLSLHLLDIQIYWQWATSLKNHGAEREVDGMFDMGAETMDLPLEEKMKFHPGDNGPTIG